MKILVWDLEIEKPVGEIEGGWDAVRQGAAGISALVIYDSETGRYHIYDKHDLLAAVDHLNTADLAVGFNSIAFDSEVVFGVTGEYIRCPQYDILHEIWKALPSRQTGFKLDDVAMRTIGAGKNSNGEFATALVKAGRWGRLFDYCLNDVHLTKELFNFIVQQGYVKAPDGSELYLQEPFPKEAA